jgi:GNAT superfamily N-acetyltransferase
MSAVVDLGFAPMGPSTRDAACELLGAFLATDPHYRASSGAYGDGGMPALRRALDLFLTRPEVGSVWVAHRNGVAVGACVVCYAISTSRGTLVAKLDDVTVRADAQRQGVGTAMLEALATWLRARGVTRIDSACHRGNAHAWRFYQKLGFVPLDEERIALNLD